MNVFVQKRIEQILVNLERGRWVYRDIEDEFILVNIAGFKANYIADNKFVWKARPKNRLLSVCFYCSNLQYRKY